MSEAAAKGQKVLCALMIDDIAIKKHVEYDGKKFCGYVNLGADYDGVQLNDNVATDPLVFMVTAVNAQWNVPVGYFLVHGLTGTERANLVNLSLQKLHDIGAEVISFTCDGPSTHWNMLSALGVNLHANNMQPFSSHPTTGAPVYVLLMCTLCFSRCAQG